MDKLRKNCEKTRFGIEIETCVHVLDHKTKIEKFADEIESLVMYYDCLRTKSPVVWEMSKDANYVPTSYDKWRVQPDDSLGCSVGPSRERDLSCVYNGATQRLSDCDKLDFFPVEIITPVLTVPRGLKEFTMVWYSTILANNFVYTVNDSQGLHINISHLDVDARRFLYWWRAFEPIIL